MDMPIPECVQKVSFTNFIAYKLFDNEHYGVRIRHSPFGDITFVSME
jgi:hypothetical protein